MAQPRHGSDVPGKSELDLSEVNVGHFGSCFHETTNLIYSFTSSSKFNSENNHKVFMVEQNDAPADQTEQEIAEVDAAEIA
jgi:hypothetical protein